ncbi:MAG: metal ABC transporter permease [Verrucomicrobiota bacterium]
MNSLIPDFSLQQFFLAPWSNGSALSSMWIALMGFFVTTACGLVGNYLILRRMALVGDAISHSILPGLVIAFLVAQSRSSTAMFIGALAAGVLTTIIIEIIHKKSRVKQDAAIGIAFTTLFAIGVILISLYASKVDLDQECVLYGEIAFVQLEPPLQFIGMNLGPLPVARMGIITLMTAAFVLIFYKQLLVSSFDPGLATSLGINASVVHYLLMCWLSVVVVSAFESVGAILVVAMLIMPGATASLISQRLPVIMLLTVVNAALSSILGIHLATWLDCSTAGAMVVMATFLFCLAWIFGSVDGLIRRWTRAKVEEPAELQMELGTEVQK